VFFLAVIVVIVSVIVLSSSHAWWIVPPYPVDDITERDILLSWSEEKALTASDHPLNDFTCIGTHNSTHEVSIFGALFIKEWHYVHAPLGAQLQLGIRHVEIDIWYNSCASRWEVYHECIDPITTASFLFEDVLRYLHQWSVLNREHFPLSINIDIKGAYRPGTSYLVPWLLGRGGDIIVKSQAYGVLEAEVRRVWVAPAALLEPSSFTQKGKTSVADGLRRQGWPSVRKLKGTALMQLNVYGELEETRAAGAGKCFFVRGDSESSSYCEVGGGGVGRVAARHGLVRGWVEKGDTDKVRRVSRAGQVYIATDHPHSLEKRSVFLNGSNR